ncbi:MAG: hypothetical protein HQL99_03750 [Magnetococcales bacterium]|nr:hypothetical protein [Magnetococcales bacterium]
MTAWNDYNDADAQNNFDLIPKGTIAPVRMVIKPGGLDDQNQGWTGGYATLSKEGESVYLSCEFVILAGEYTKRKVWSLIGLYSPKGPEWENMGRSFIRAILNSARGLSDKDTSPRALEARRIRGFADLDGIEFLAKIDVEKDANGDPKNVIKFAITPDQKEYQGFQPAAAPVAQAGFQQNTNFQPATTAQPVMPAPAANNWRHSTQQAAPTQGQNGAGNFTRPAWAQ